MNDDQLRTLIRDIVDKLAKGEPGDAIDLVQPLRDAGIEPNMKVGLEQEAYEEGRTRMEWYAGQILDVVDSKSWLAVNSIVNCVDRFCP